MKSFKVSVLCILMVYFQVATLLPVPGSPHRVFYADSENGMNRAGFSTFKSDNEHHDIGYSYAGVNNNVRYGLGLVDHSVKINENFEVKNKLGVLGAEIDWDIPHGKLGSMARVTGIDITYLAGPAVLNLGFNIDTGVQIDNGLEVKFLGIGGKAGKDGVEVCFFVCFGIGW